MGVSEEDLQDPEKVKELSEKIEAENKAKKDEEPPDPAETKEEKVLGDQLGRLAKAIAKQVKPNEPVKPEAPGTTTLSELDVDNRVFTETQKLTPEQTAILKEHSHLPRNKGKSFKDIFATNAAKADFSDLQADLDAKDEIDANADPDRLLETKSEIVEKHSKTGETPKTEAEHRIVAEAGLEGMGFREF